MQRCSGGRYVSQCAAEHPLQALQAALAAAGVELAARPECSASNNGLVAAAGGRC